MTFREFLNEGSNIFMGLHPLDLEKPEPAIKKLGDAFGKNVGVFTLKDNKYRYMYLPEDEISKGAFRHLKLNSGEYLVRVITLTSAIGNGQAPLIKINPSKGLVWFLKDYEADIEDLEFETKSEKITSMRTSLK